MTKLKILCLFLGVCIIYFIYILDGLDMRPMKQNPIQIIDSGGQAGWVKVQVVRSVNGTNRGTRFTKYNQSKQCTAVLYCASASQEHRTGAPPTLDLTSLASIQSTCLKSIGLTESASLYHRFWSTLRGSEALMFSYDAHLIFLLHEQPFPLTSIFVLQNKILCFRLYDKTWNRWRGP